MIIQTFWRHVILLYTIVDLLHIFGEWDRASERDMELQPLMGFEKYQTWG